MPYERVACLGSGFSGEVWLEQDLALNRQCAAKYLNTDRIPAGLEFSEARVMLGAEHDNVVRVFSADIEFDDRTGAELPVIRMEYLPKGSVADCHHGEPLAVAEAIHVLEEACRGVEALHARGILHRDLKPANLLIGEGGRIKVSDFGLACVVEDLPGAPPWGYTEHLPPEAFNGSGGINTVAGDVYALGVTLYRMLNGDAAMRSRVTPESNVRALIAAGKYPDRTKWQPYIHDRLRRVVRKAMHCDPSHRYRSASELRHALEAVRPAMSWMPVVAAGSDMAWEAVSFSDASKCRARLSPNSQGMYVFELERQGPSGIFRASKQDRLVGALRSEILEQAACVLQRVATDGR
jgi:eukaryotic-like serine/threonine-protein kinase